MRALAAGAVLLALAWVLYMVLLARHSRRRRPRLGVEEGRLRSCRRPGRCVSSAHGDVPPLAAAGGDAGKALERLVAMLRAQSLTEVVTATPTYVHAVARTRVFGFADDLELLADPAAGVVHVRSASRVGINDRGENRRRVEALRQALAAPPT